MKEELLKQLGSMVEFTKDGILKGIEILQVQAPELVEQVLAFTIAADIIAIVFSLIVIGLEAFFIKRYIEKDEEWCIYPMIVFGVATLLAIIAIPCAVYEIVKVIIAPKLFLLEYITTLMKG